MKRNAFIKAVFRQPVRSLLMLLLIGAITYGITSHVVEYIAVLNVTKQLEKYYKPIGKLDNENYDVTSGRELASKSPYVEFEDVRRSCSGVLKDLYNADIDGLLGHVYESYVNDVIFYGVLQDKKYVVQDKRYLEETGKNINEVTIETKEVGEYQLSFKVNKVEAGYPDYLTEGKLIYVNYVPTVEGELEEEYDALQIGEQYLIRTYYSESQLDNTNNTPGQAERGNIGQWFLLDKLTEDNLYFYHINEGTEIDYSDEKLSGLKELVDIIKENQRSMEVVGTKDMSLMPDFHINSRRFYLADGRWLNREDDLGEKKICVVNSFFAKKRGLSVGDKITLKLRNMEGTYCGYICRFIPEGRNKWKTYETVEQEFEIVGLYGEVPQQGVIITSYTNTLYIPDSCMPVNFVPEMLKVINKVYYSFALKSAQDQEVFLAENRKALENMGINVSFVNNKADSFAISARNLKKSTLMSLWIFTVAFIPTLELIVLIYLSQRRREFAIVRAMGTSRRSAIHQVGAAAAGIGLPGIALGGIAAWYKTMEKVRDKFKEFAVPEGAGSISFLPAYWLLLIIICIFIIFIISILIGTSFIAKRPVLELLQGQAGGRNISRKNDIYAGAAAEAGASRDIEKRLDGMSLNMHYGSIPAMTHMEVTKRAGRGRTAAAMRHIYRHMTRSYGKSILMLVITVGFITAFGWLYWTIQQNLAEADRLYNSIVIDGEIYTYTTSNYGGGVIKPIYVENILKSGLVKESYLEETALANSLTAAPPEGKLSTNTKDTDVAILSFNDWDQFLIETGKELTLEFIQGYDGKTLIQDEGKVPEVIMSKMKMVELGKKLGDIIYLNVGEECISCGIIGSYLGTISKGAMENPIIMSEYQMRDFTDNYNYLTVRFTFDPSKNKELIIKGQDIEKVVNSKSTESLYRLIIWDDELQKIIEPMERNLSFLKIIYPVAVAVFSLIGTALSFLMILLRAKEAAAMRVLGSSKNRVRIIFTVENVVVCALGSVLGIILTVALHGGVWVSTLINILIYLSCCIIGTVCGSFFVTSKVPLELLQVKE